MSQRERHAEKARVNADELDTLGMLRRLASLKGSSPRRPAIARALFITALVISHSVAAATDIKTKEVEQKPVYDVMNVKLYLHNKINDWDQFECANQLRAKASCVTHTPFAMPTTLSLSHTQGIVRRTG